MDRFRACGAVNTDFQIVVPWIRSATAFTVPGEYIFFARSLLQECATDEMAAFVIAHEIAHHQLGHLSNFPESISESISSEIHFFIAAFFRGIASRIHGPEDECDADRHALDLCVQAGYDGSECLKIFDKLEKLALDRGDIKAAFGPDESDDELAPEAPPLTKFRIWLFQRRYGYLPIRDRREMLLKHLNSKGGCPLSA